MFSFDRFTRVATATVGALVLSTLTITAAVGPVRVYSPVETASARIGTQANA